MLWLVLSASLARAQEPSEAPRILLLVDDQAEALKVRLQAELAALGFLVVVADEPMLVTSRENLELAARKADAVAALRVRPSTRGVEVWVTDRVTGKTVLREVVLSDASSSHAEQAALVSVGAVELLRASLLEVESKLPSRGEIETPAAMRALARDTLAGAQLPAVSTPVPTPVPAPIPPAFLPRPATAVLGPSPESPVWVRRLPGPPLGFAHPSAISRWWISGGVGALVSSGAGASPNVLLGVSWLPVEHFDVGLDFVLPTWPSFVDDGQDQSAVRVSLFGLGADVVFLERTSTFNAQLGVGVAAAWLNLDGTTVPPNIGRAANLVTALPYLRARAHYRTSPATRLVLDTRVGVAWPRPVIRFAGREVASWGRPMGMLGLRFDIGVGPAKPDK